MTFNTDFFFKKAYNNIYMQYVLTVLLRESGFYQVASIIKLYF
jgi:hypothetical protein